MNLSDSKEVLQYIPLMLHKIHTIIQPYLLQFSEWQGLPLYYQFNSEDFPNCPHGRKK